MMREKYFLTFLFLMPLRFAFAQDSSRVDTLWKKGGLANLNFSQTTLSNWQGGGDNALAGNASLNLFAVYKHKRSSWDNTLDLSYGKLQAGNAPIRKNDDKIDLNSKYGYSFAKRWNYSALVNFKSQFDNGYAYPNDSVVISHFAAPAYSLVAIGFEYKNTVPDFSLFLSPLTVKTTLVNNDRLANEGAYGVEKATYDPVTGVLLTPGKKVRNEIGGYLRMLYKQEFDKNVLFQTKLELFSNYQHNPGNIDVNWETLISFKINKFFTASISTNLVYDDDIKIKVDEDKNGIIEGVGPRVQFKEILAIGLSYKF
jgi:hypothetical protein